MSRGHPRDVARASSHREDALAGMPRREGILASRGCPREVARSRGILARHARGMREAARTGVRVKSVWHAEGWRLTAWGAGEER